MPCCGGGKSKNNSDTEEDPGGKQNKQRAPPKRVKKSSDKVQVKPEKKKPKKDLSIRSCYCHQVFQDPTITKSVRKEHGVPAGCQPPGKDTTASKNKQGNKSHNKNQATESNKKGESLENSKPSKGNPQQNKPIIWQDKNQTTTDQQSPNPSKRSKA